MIEVIARAAIVDDKRRALLVRTKGGTMPFLVGGHVEAGESIVHALRREVSEELGVACRVLDACGVVEHRWADEAGRDRLEVNHVFRVALDVSDPATVTSHEAALEVEWCPLDELDARNVQPAPMRVLLRLVAEGPAGVAVAARMHECTFATPRPCVIRRVRSGDVDGLCMARLHALAEMPAAFGATLARDLAMSDDHWRAWAEERGFDASDTLRRATFVADDGEALRGLITIAEGSEAPLSSPDPRAFLFAMWVHPTYRGAREPLSVAPALVHAAVDWARDNGFAFASLAVTTTNERARKLYERLGFVATGKTWPLQHTPTIALHEMERPLSQG